MALSFNSVGNNALLTNGTTAIDVVASPGASVFRSVRCITINNTDTAPATVSIDLNVSGTLYTLFKQTLAVDQTMVFGDGNFFCVLDLTTKKIQVVLAGAVTTNQLAVIASWGDYL
jgi:hypothetical protein